MSRNGVTVVVGILAAGMIFVAGRTTAQDPTGGPRTRPAPPRVPESSLPEIPPERLAALTERVVYAVRSGPATQLANALQRHFSGNAEIRAVAEPVSNTLLISMRPGQQQEVLAVLTELDRAPGMVTIEAMIIERTDNSPAEGEKNTNPNPINPDEFTGPLAQVKDKLAALPKADRAVHLRSLRLTTLNNQLAQVQFGDDAGSGSGRNFNVQGGFSSAPTRRPAGGFIFSATPRISKGDMVTLEAAVHDRSQAFQTVADRNTAADGRSTIGGEPLHSSALTTVSIPSGHAVVVGGMSSVAGSQRSQYLVIVAASVLRMGSAD